MTKSHPKTQSESKPAVRCLFPCQSCNPDATRNLNRHLKCNKKVANVKNGWEIEARDFSLCVHHEWSETWFSKICIYRGFTLHTCSDVQRCWKQKSPARGIQQTPIETNRLKCTFGRWNAKNTHLCQLMLRFKIHGTEQRMPLERFLSIKKSFVLKRHICLIFFCSWNGPECLLLWSYFWNSIYQLGSRKVNSFP